MPNPHIHTTIASLSQPWFMGPELGPKYGVLLSDELALRHDHAAIDTALNLGGYLLHTQSAKNQREAVRAALLATFVMKKQPLTMRDTLVKQYKDKSIDSLKIDFKHQFPAVNDAARPQWAPANFTDAAGLAAYSQPKDWTRNPPPPYTIMVHTVRHKSDVLDKPIATLSQWFAISMGVMSDAKPICYSNHGLILGVPATNIITTSPTDQWFDNYAGTNRSMKAPGVSMADHIIDKNLRIGGMLTPTQVLARQNTPQALQNMAGTAITQHNEVVVCGIPGLTMPWGGHTAALTLIGVFVQTRMDGTIPEIYMKSQGPAKQIELAAKSCAIQQHVPLFYLPTTLAL